jgi:mRNA guanylyltransferase
MKASGEQYDDRIGEFAWIAKDSRWRFLRFRDDKPQGNYVDVVHNICLSIADGVEQVDVRNLSSVQFCLS